MKLPGTVRIEAGQDGLRRMVVKTPLAEADVYLHGAHVTHFQPRGQKPVLFMSEKSSFEPGKPIRGGIPICFPWFGARQDGREGPAHGFARLQEWELIGVKDAANGVTDVTLRLASGAITHAMWDGDFEAHYTVRVGETLGLELSVRNTSPQPMHFEEALHSYLSVSDVKQVGIEGLAGVTYSDRVGTPHTEKEGAAPIRITAETDRIYMNTQSACIVHDPGWKRKLVVEKSGSDSTVVWNPWIAKAKAMPDFGDDEWLSMLCIETCNVREQAITLPPGQSQVMSAIIRAE
jgi:glucose-6-phosphate 1-epimerase